MISPSLSLSNKTVTLSVSTPDRFEEVGRSSYIVIDSDGTIRPLTSDPVRAGTNNSQVQLTATALTGTTAGSISVIASYRSSLSRKSKTSAASY